MASKALATIAAIFMVAGSTAAVAQSAARTGAAATQEARVGAQTQDSNEFAGSIEWVLAALALGLIIFGIIHFTDDQNNSNSP